jgi:hypothetical protein
MIVRDKAPPEVRIVPWGPSRPQAGKDGLRKSSSRPLTSSSRVMFSERILQWKLNISHIFSLKLEDSAAPRQGERNVGRPSAALLHTEDESVEPSSNSTKAGKQENGAGSSDDVEIPIEEEPTVQQLVHDDPKVACDILEHRAKKKLKTFSVKVQ